MRNKMNETIKDILLWLLGIVVIAFVLLVVLFFVRLNSDRYLDDVSPGIPCSEQLLNKADVLFVIPKFENKSIADDKEWCMKILSLNKTLAMHGVYHTYNEFGIDRSKAYVQEGAEIFNQCFGFYPTMFKAPQLEISRNNAAMIKKSYVLNDRIMDLVHRTYHCDDGGKYPNWLYSLI